jgi:SNF2 family DNA or RNA helicase
LDTDFASSVKIHNPPFRLLSNKTDLEHTQPPNFNPEKLPLRPEQLRSLTWMIAREKEDSEPFVEEEISEAILEPLGWRAEGRAQRPVRIRGGVLADQVGYGKTAITLGLIDCTAKSVKKEFNQKGDIIGKVPVQATLVIVPPHLTRQWRSEAQKFARNRFKNIVEISTAAQINNLTIEDIQDADLIIVASNLFQSTVYLANLEAFAAGGSLPTQDGRYFNARLNITLQSLRDQVEQLKTEGSASVMANIRDARKHGMCIFSRLTYSDC